MQGWPRTLTWNDFRPVSNPGPGQFVALNGCPIVARVSLSIWSRPSQANRGADQRIALPSPDVSIHFDGLEYVPSRIPPGKEAHYLKHEQGHLDLMGLFARELEVKLLGLRAASVPELSRLVDATVEQAVENAQMYAINTPGRDCLYDRDTNHGMREAKQRYWNVVITRNILRWQRPDYQFTW